MDSLAVRAAERVLALTEQRYGVGAHLPDALTSQLLLATLSELGGGIADLRLLIDAGVLEPWYADLWPVWLTGRADAILEPPHEPEPEPVVEPIGPLLTPAGDAVAVLPTGTVSIPIPIEGAA